MATAGILPQNFEERVIWISITGTYAFYVLGALYVVAPVIAWILLARLCWRLLLQGPHTAPADRLHVPLTLWIWVLGMFAMLVALVVAHLDFKLGTGQLIKSSIGWAKGWALLAIFPLLGCLPIRPELIYRACMVVCKHTLLLLPVFVGAYIVHLPPTPYVSPLRAIGGPGPEFFALSLYEIEPGGGVRWRLFTPWAPAVGLVANVYFIFALAEREAKWKWLGIVASLAMIMMSKSRLALVSLAFVGLASWGMSRLTKPSTYFAGGAVFPIIGMAGAWLLDKAEQFWQAFRSARADSTRVREALARIAADRWRSEAPLWGHGIVERGPHLVEYMPIGSHHSWYGLLFVKGAVGFVALLLPMLWTFLALLIRAQHSALGRTGLALILILLLYTFGENLEILAYLFWPALVIIGCALNESHRQTPF